MQLVCPDGEVDLALASVGGEAITASDVHYSHPSNLLRPTRSAGMWDGWETKRRRGPGSDWVVVRLGMRGKIDRLLVDSTHFKGNCPGWVSAEVSDDGETWTMIADQEPVAPHQENVIPMAGASGEFLRLSIHPDGGLARLRVLGAPDVQAAGAKRADYLDSLFPQAARSFFETACASTAWVEQMIERRPFGTPQGVHREAELAFGSLSEGDWLEAFGGHPRIGERGDATANREQSGTASASRETIRELIDVNRAYEEKFGFTYIVYATGKTADEMLAIARERLDNDREHEVAVAAGEQRKITTTRLRRMLCQEV
jgi:allantoicase